jgi:hypothetical protein
VGHVDLNVWGFPLYFLARLETPSKRSTFIKPWRGGWPGGKIHPIHSTLREKEKLGGQAGALLISIALCKTAECYLLNGKTRF